LGQWFVPVVTIVALGCVPKGQSVQAAVVGMLLGSLLNVLWVVYQLKSAGISFFPNMPSFRLLAPVLIVYRHLLFAGFLPAILVPMNYSFAAGINAGSVSAWAFTSKIVVLFSGLASVVATSVVLPHLAGLLIHGGQGHIRRDTNILLLLSAWAGGLLSVGVFLFAEPLVATLLSKNLYQNQVVELTNIVKVGSLQLPMVIAGALITKLAIVANNSKRMMYAVFLGFIANLLVNIMLVSHFGVMGVAVGAMAGTATSTTALILSAHRSVGLKFKDVAVLLSTWLVWVGVCVGVTSRSAAALTSVLFAVAGMTWAHYFLLKSEKQIKEQPV
jgi:peptidoglycan biosynthesis protein MviN/MurJ (putative lipid II flippase)